MIFGAETQSVSSREDGKYIFYQSAEGLKECVADEILLGVGRAPNVEGFGLEKAGVDFDLKKGVIVDECLRTSNRKIWACGDVCLPYKFTHTAEASAKIAVQNALFHGRKKIHELIIPWCTYTDPEIAHTGLYEQEALAKGIKISVFKQSLEEVDRAITDGETNGFVKVITVQGSDKIIGATVVARHAGELISELTLAMRAGVGLKTIADTIHPYPTQAEAIKKVAYAYNKTLLTPFAAKFLKFLIKFT